MKCLICRQADPMEGFTSIYFKREEFQILIRNVPSQICPYCGEAIVDEEVAIQLLNRAEEAVNQGMMDVVCEY